MVYEKLSENVHEITTIVKRTLHNAELFCIVKDNQLLWVITIVFLVGSDFYKIYFPKVNFLS